MWELWETGPTPPALGNLIHSVSETELTFCHIRSALLLCEYVGDMVVSLPVTQLSLARMVFSCVLLCPLPGVQVMLPSLLPGYL